MLAGPAHMVTPDYENYVYFIGEKQDIKVTDWLKVRFPVLSLLREWQFDEGERVQVQASHASRLCHVGCMGSQFLALITHYQVYTWYNISKLNLGDDLGDDLRGSYHSLLNGS